MNSVDKIIKVFGGEGLGAKARAARALGMSPPAFNHWVKKKRIPSTWHQRILTRASEMNLKLKPSDLVDYQP